MRLLKSIKIKALFTEFLPKLLGFQTVVEGWWHVVMNVGHFDSQSRFYEILVNHVCSLILTFTSKNIFTVNKKIFALKLWESNAADKKTEKTVIIELTSQSSHC